MSGPAQDPAVDDIRVGRAIRFVRIRRGWRQEDLARAAGVSRSVVSRLERGDLEPVQHGTIRRVAGALSMRVETLVRWRGGDLERMLGARHGLLHEQVARRFATLGGWVAVPEVTFAVYGERGAIDVLAWHAASRTVLVVELKTEIVDVQELLATLDRKRRLGATVALERGWAAQTVTAWVIIVEDRTNRRRVAAHRALLRAALPADGHAVRRWLRAPSGPLDALSFWPDAPSESTRPSMRPVRRVRRRAADRGRGE
jgi:transcriptional regulator with XRE-family HTH domain